MSEVSYPICNKIRFSVDTVDSNLISATHESLDIFDDEIRLAWYLNFSLNRLDTNFIALFNLDVVRSG